MRIRISSDSTCDLSRDYLLTHQVELVPLYTFKGGKTFRDGVDITPADIFEHVAAGGDLCSTAANNVEDYHEVFSRLLEDCDAVIHITISLDFSSCYQNACVAAEDFPGKVFVVDSRNLSTGHGHVVCEAVKMAEAGELGPEEIAESLRELTSRVDASFLLDRLDYMVKGGRCSSVVALGGKLLRIKPEIAVIDGTMKMVDKYRGSFDKCVEKYVKDILKDQKDICLDRIFITHSPVPDGAVEIARETIKKYTDFQDENIFETSTNCTVACHCGPGTLGVLFMTK